MKKTFSNQNFPNHYLIYQLSCILVCSRQQKRQRLCYVYLNLCFNARQKDCTHASAGVLGITSMTNAPEVTSGKSVVLPFSSCARLQQNQDRHILISIASFKSRLEVYGFYIKSPECGFNSLAIKSISSGQDRRYRGSTHVGVRLIILTPMYFFFVVFFPVKKMQHHITTLTSDFSRFHR